MLISVIELQSGQIGLAILSSIGLTGTCQWGIRASAELESQMISVERITEYADLPSEPPLESNEKDAPPRDWPRNGNIEFKSLSLRYAENSARTLQNLTFQINAKVEERDHFLQRIFKLKFCFYISAKNRCCWSYRRW